MSITDYPDFRKIRTKVTPAKQVKKSKDLPVVVSTSPAITPQVEDRDEKEKKILKDFDHDYRYGPTMGITRLERWERAYELGLDPDPAVKDILESHSSRKEYTQCVLDSVASGLGSREK